jgi:hypothetical protein
MTLLSSLSSSLNSPLHRSASACIAIIAAVFAAISPAAALTPLPPGQISDQDAVRLLKGAYKGESMTLTGDWSAKHRYPGDDNSEAVAVSRNVCADSGRDAYGPRMIAVCTSYEEAGHVTPGLVDLWLLLDPRNQQPARIGASERDIASGGFGTPGQVSFFAVGPARTAFAVDSGYANMGWSTSVRTLYFAESDRFEKVLSFGTELSNGGACDPDEDAMCKKKSIGLECTLRADTAKVTQGFYAMRLEVKGQRGGKPANRRIAIPFQNGTYRVPQQQLERRGCDQGL